mgnify:FL=1
MIKTKYEVFEGYYRDWLHCSECKESKLPLPPQTPVCGNCGKSRVFRVGRAIYKVTRKGFLGIWVKTGTEVKWVEWK